MRLFGHFCRSLRSFESGALGQQLRSAASGQLIVLVIGLASSRGLHKNWKNEKNEKNEKIGSIRELEELEELHISPLPVEECVKCEAGRSTLSGIILSQYY